MAVDFVAWHDRSSQNHQTQMDTFGAQGFRFVSLSVYGTVASPLYAAVMVKRPAVVAQREFHDLNATQMQQRFEEMAKEGMGPTIICATGSITSPLFAAVFEPSSGIPLTRTALTETEFNALNHSAKWDEKGNPVKNPTVLTWAGVYGGTSDNLRYIGIWRSRGSHLSWTADGTRDTPSEYQARFNAQFSARARPALVTMSSSQRHLSIFRDDAIGPFAARHGMTSAGYQAEFDKLVEEGFFPLNVQGAGSGDGRRFAALFTKQEAPATRVHTVKGSPQVDGVDKAVQKVMQADGVRGAALAIVDGTRLVLARGYTFAEPGYPVVTPTTLFRIASVSKTFVAVAVHQLLQEGMSDQTLIKDILTQVGPPAGKTKNPFWDQVTVRHLLEQTSGLQPWFSGRDAEMVGPNGVFKNAPFPATANQIMSFMCTQPQVTHGEIKEGGDAKPIEPGDSSHAFYNNFGYFLLGQVVAKKRGTGTFTAAIQNTILTPLKMTRVRQCQSLVTKQASDEARYHAQDLDLGSSVFSADRTLVPVGYGDECLEVGEGAGGLSAAVVDLARLLAALDVPDPNPLMPASRIATMFQRASSTSRGHGWDQATSMPNGGYGQKGGSLPASQNVIMHRSGTLGMALCWNRAGVFSGDWYPNFPEVISAAQNASLPPGDLFPQFGMPSFGSAPKPVAPLSLAALPQASLDDLLVDLNPRLRPRPRPLTDAGDVLRPVR